MKTVEIRRTGGLAVAALLVAGAVRASSFDVASGEVKTLDDSTVSSYDAASVAAGGVLVQLLPFADESVIAKLEENAASLTGLSHLFDEGKSLSDIADIALRGIEYDLFDTLDGDYRCNCSRDRVKQALVSIGREELEKLAQEQEETQIECHFCDKKYVFSKEEILDLLK